MQRSFTPTPHWNIGIWLPVLIGLPLACSGSGSSSSSGAGTGMGAGAGSGTTPPGQEQPARRNAAALPAKGPQRLVGVLTEQAQRRCLAHFKVEWVNSYHAVGFIRVLPRKGRDLASRLNKLVVLHGQSQASYRAPAVKHAAECPPMQMRNDWVPGKHGMRLRRRNPAGAQSPAAFAASRAEPFTGLAVTQKGDKIFVTLKNPFDRPLPGAVITVHYEGCYGKPGAPQIDRQVGALKPGQRVTETFPKHHVLPGSTRKATRRGRYHYAYSVQVSTRAPDILFELDVRLNQFLGPAPRCPPR